MTAYTVESYLTDYVYSGQGYNSDDPLPGDHDDTIRLIRGGISTSPWEDQSVGVNDEGEKLYEADFLDLAASVGLSAHYVNSGMFDLAIPSLKITNALFGKYVDKHPELEYVA